MTGNRFIKKLVFHHFHPLKIGCSEFQGATTQTSSYDGAKVCFVVTYRPRRSKNLDSQCLGRDAFFGGGLGCPPKDRLVGSLPNGLNV